MKSLLSAVLLVGTALATDTVQDNREYINPVMERLMGLKTEFRAQQHAEGVFQANNYPPITTFQPCQNGKAGTGADVFACDNVDLHGFISHQDMGSTTREGNDVWGWTSADGREFGIVGETDGTAFVEVLKDGSLQFVGRLPTQTTSAIWRDMKVIGDYVYIGSEAKGHGLQVFDLKKLLDVKPVLSRFAAAKTFSPKTDLAFWYNGFGNSHNIVANKDTNYIYAVGSNQCRGGLYMLDVSNPLNVTSPGCMGADGYTHDAQCVIYKGPDAKYYGKEICFGYNEDTLTIFDMTNKPDASIISRTAYKSASYTHQGWLVSDDMEYLLLDDELDEMDKKNPGLEGHTTTYIWSIKSLEKPINTGYYQSPAKAIDHNQYTKNGLSYQANYGSGLRVVDISSISQDPTGKSMKQAGFFDCHPEDDARNGDVEFFGSWSTYIYFKSGYLLLNSIERGIFSLKYTG